METLPDTGNGSVDTIAALFAESVGRFVVEVRPDDVEKFLAVMDGGAQKIGTVIADPVLRLPGIEQIDLAELLDAFGAADREDPTMREDRR